MTAREVFALVDQLAKGNPRLQIYLGGAEPYIREDFEIILRHIKNRDLRVSFTTNGTLLDRRRLQEIVAIGVDNVSFSVDGDRELHDRQRGVGAFEKVTGSVKGLFELRSQQRAKKPVIAVNITVTPGLTGQVGNALRSIKDATGDGADYYRIHHQWYVSPGELAAHQSTVESTLGCRARGAEAHLIPGSSLPDPAALADEMDSLRQDPKVIMFPDLRRADIMSYYSEGPRVSKRCIASLLGAVVKPNGDVLFCPDGWIDDYVLGNVRQQSFKEIWNNDRARRFRAVLIRERHFQGCNRCSWMYAY